MIRCPICGSRLDFVFHTLSERQKKIRDAIEKLHRDNGRWPIAREIGCELGYSDREMRRELVKMEEMGVLIRFGTRSGWVLKSEHIAVISV